MSENFQQMSSSLADEFINALEGVNQATKEYEKTMRQVMPDMVDQIVLKVWEKNLYYTERYVSAWPITRWWWKRKMEKSKVALEKANQFALEMKGIIKTNSDVVN